MLAIFVVVKGIFNLSVAGRVMKTTTHAIDLVDHLLKTDRLEEIEKELSQGVNREEERWAEEQYKMAEPFFPFAITREVVSEDLEKYLGLPITGEFVLKLSEWQELRYWLGRVAYNMNHEDQRKEGLDGRWLLRCGRVRWEDARFRSHAFTCRDHYRDVVENEDGVLWQLTG